MSGLPPFYAPARRRHNAPPSGSNPWDREPARAPLWVLPHHLLQAADLLTQAADGSLRACMNLGANRRDPAYQLLAREGLRRGMNVGRFEETAFLAARDLLTLPVPLLQQALLWEAPTNWTRIPAGWVNQPPTWFTGTMVEFRGAFPVIRAAILWMAGPLPGPLADPADAPALLALPPAGPAGPAPAPTTAGPAPAPTTAGSAAGRGSVDLAPARAPAGPMAACGSADPAPAAAPALGDEDEDSEGALTEADEQYQQEKRLSKAEKQEITWGGRFPDHLPGTWRRHVRRSRLPGETSESAEARCFQSATWEDFGDRDLPRSLGVLDS